MATCELVIDPAEARDSDSLVKPWWSDKSMLLELEPQRYFTMGQKLSKDVNYIQLPCTHRREIIVPDVSIQKGWNPRSRSSQTRWRDCGQLRWYMKGCKKLLVLVVVWYSDISGSLRANIHPPTGPFDASLRATVEMDLFWPRTMFWATQRLGHATFHHLLDGISEIKPDSTKRPCLGSWVLEMFNCSRWEIIGVRMI